MLGKMIGAFAGEQIARRMVGGSGIGGALIGAAVPMVLRRMGPGGLAAAAIGGYVVKKVLDRNAPGAAGVQPAPAASAKPAANPTVPPA